jgi:Tol biopolymer transport system component
MLSAATPSGQIAYLSGARQDDRCVCLLDIKSGETTRVGAGVFDGKPAWAPDGARLAFSTRRDDGGFGLRIVSMDGGEPVDVTHAKRFNINPQWSPGALLLAYESFDEDGLDHEIRVYDPTARTESVWCGGKTGLMRPVWLPNLRIFDLLPPAKDMAWQDGKGEVERGYEPRGDEPILLLLGYDNAKKKKSASMLLGSREAVTSLLPDDAYLELRAEPSPNGRCIAYESNDGGDREIFVASKNALADVSNHREADWNPVWSPKSDWLAFESFRTGTRKIYRVHAETGRVTPVDPPAYAPENKTSDPVFAKSQDWSPTWSPDGKWIAFVSNRTGDSELFVADAEGGPARRLTEHPGPDLAPVWRPRSK